MVSCSNRLCSCSFHCFPKDCLVRSERMSERRITGRPSSIGKLESHPSQCRIPETISAFSPRALTRERVAPQSGQQSNRSKLAFNEDPPCELGKMAACHAREHDVYAGGITERQAGVN